MAVVAPTLSPTPTPDGRAADHVVRVLADHGVTLALGVPGGAIGAVYDALLDEERIRAVHTHDEPTAVFAAAAYGRQAERPAVVLTTSGPGILHTTHALASARADGLPLVLLAGEVPRARQGQGALQDGSQHDLDVVHALAPYTKAARAVPTASALVPMLLDALQTAMAAPRGPVLLTVPADLLTARLPPTRMFVAAPSQAAPSDPETLAHLLMDTPSVTILAGSGCRSAAGARALRHLAETLGAPVMTTPKAKGVFPESHPLSLGIHGVVGGHPSAAEAVEAGFDTLLVLGSSLGELATSGWSEAIVPRRHLIQVDAGLERVGRSYPVTHAVHCTVEAFAAAVVPLLPPAREPSPRTGLHRLPRGEARTERLHPVDAIREIQHICPPDTVFCVDSGEHTFFAAQHLHIDAPDGWLCMLGLGSMASAPGGALGVALAQPDRPVACICGDGGLLMGLGALATAAEHGLPVRIFVFDDGRLGMVENGQTAIYGRSHTFGTGPVDLAAAARALGVTAFTVREAGELVALSDTLDAIEGPVLIDLLIDRGVSMPKGGRLSTLSDKKEVA